jgi:hypothetical protein
MGEPQHEDIKADRLQMANDVQVKAFLPVIPPEAGLDRGTASVT